MNADNLKSALSGYLPAAGAVFLLRHGLTDGGDRRFVGQSDSPLTGYGRRQIEAWRRWMGPVSLTTIASSDLGRARETAAILATGRSVTPRVLTELREIHLGAWEGKSFDEIRTQQPEAFAQRGADLAGFRPPGGESFSDLQRRVMPAFRRLAAENRERLVIVGHAGVNRVILCHLLGLPLQHLFRLGQAAGALNILLPRPDGWRIEAVNLRPELLA